MIFRDFHEIPSFSESSGHTGSSGVIQGPVESSGVIQGPVESSGVQWCSVEVSLVVFS